MQNEGVSRPPSCAYLRAKALVLIGTFQASFMPIRVETKTAFLTPSVQVVPEKHFSEQEESGNLSGGTSRQRLVLPWYRSLTHLEAEAVRRHGMQPVNHGLQPVLR